MGIKGFMRWLRRTSKCSYLAWFALQDCCVFDGWIKCGIPCSDRLTEG